MTVKGYPLVDVDAHYYDDFHVLIESMDDDDPWKERVEQGIKNSQDDNEKTFWPSSVYSRSDMGVRRPNHASTQEIQDSMDRLGVDKALLIGQIILGMGNVQADDWRPIKYTRSYVKHLLDNVVSPENGIYMTVPIIHSDPTAAAEIIDEVGDNEAVAGTCLVPAGVQPPFGNHKYDPIWKACQNHDLPVVIHGAGASLDHHYLSGFKHSAETHALGFVISNMAQITSMVVQGVPEKFPELDLVFQESGLMYLPMLMHRLDQVYLRNPDEAPLLKRKPSEYMKEFYYGTQPLEVVPNENYLKWTFEMLGGADRIMFASDWPHPDSDEPNVITDLAFLSDEEKAKILGGNAEKVFDISGPSMQDGDGETVEKVIREGEDANPNK